MRPSKSPMPSADDALATTMPSAPGIFAVVAIAPEPHLIEGKLPARYLAPVTHWVALNADALLRYWNGEIGTGGLLRELRRVDQTGGT